MTAPPLPPAQSMDDLRAALLKTHGSTVGRDDPVLMVYTIHRAALGETVQALDDFRAKLAEEVASISAAHTSEVRVALDGISEVVMSDALKQRLAAMQEAAVLADRTTTAMRRIPSNRLALLSLANGIAAVLVIAAALVVLR